MSLIRSPAVERAKKKKKKEASRMMTRKKKRNSGHLEEKNRKIASLKTKVQRKKEPRIPLSTIPKKMPALKIPKVPSKSRNPTTRTQPARIRTVEKKQVKTRRAKATRQRLRIQWETLARVRWELVRLRVVLRLRRVALLSLESRKAWASWESPSGGKLRE